MYLQHLAACVPLAEVLDMVYTSHVDQFYGDTSFARSGNMQLLAGIIDRNRIYNEL